MEYNVSLIFSADMGITVNADSPEEAAEIAYSSDQATPSLCHQCANDVNLGDCVRVIVYDSDDNEVLDDGFERNQITGLSARIAELEQLAKEMAEGIEREQRIIPSVHFERLLSRYREVCGGGKSPQSIG